MYVCMYICNVFVYIYRYNYVYVDINDTMGMLGVAPSRPGPKRYFCFTKIHSWVFPLMGVPQNGWFLREHPIKVDDLGVSPFPPFVEPPICSHMMWSKLTMFLPCYCKTAAVGEIQTERPPVRSCVCTDFSGLDNRKSVGAAFSNSFHPCHIFHPLVFKLTT